MFLAGSIKSDIYNFRRKAIYESGEFQEKDATDEHIQEPDNLDAEELLGLLDKIAEKLQQKTKYKDLPLIAEDLIVGRTLKEIGKKHNISLRRAAYMKDIVQATVDELLQGEDDAH